MFKYWMICLWALDKQLECQYFIHGSSIDPFKVENFQLENDYVLYTPTSFTILELMEWGFQMVFISKLGYDSQVLHLFLVWFILPLVRL